MFSWNTFLIGSLIATHFLSLMQSTLKRRDIYNVDINSIIANDMSFISHIKNELYNFKPFFQECNGKTTYRVRQTKRESYGKSSSRPHDSAPPFSFYLQIALDLCYLEPEGQVCSFKKVP